MGNTGFLGLSVGDYQYFETVPKDVVLKASGQLQTGGDYFIVPLSENQDLKDAIDEDEETRNLYKGKEQNAYVKVSDAKVVPKDGGRRRSAKKGGAAKLETRLERIKSVLRPVNDHSKLAVVLRDLCKETEQEIKKKKATARSRKAKKI
jgi:hypothetical protein